MLEEPPQAALSPPQPLTPQRAERLDGLLPHRHLGRKRHVPAIGSQARRQLQVLGQGPWAPAADRLEGLTAHEHPVAAQLGGAVRRPSAALAGQVHELLLGLHPGQPRDRCVARLASDLDRIGRRVADPGAHRALQEVGLHDRVRVDRTHDFAAQLAMRPRERRSLRARA
jgi:hypothetical protein